MSKGEVYRTKTLYSLAGSLAANGTVSASLPCAGYSTLVGIFRSDVASSGTASTVNVQQSCDGGLTWDIISSSALATACAASSFNIGIVGDTVLFQWKNGGTNAACARVHLYLRP